MVAFKVFAGPASSALTGRAAAKQRPAAARALGCRLPARRQACRGVVRASTETTGARTRTFRCRCERAASALRR